MRGTIATASRDVLAIKKRKVSYYAYRGLQELARLWDNKDEAINALLYPHIESRDVLIDLLNRLAWYLPSTTLHEEAEISLVVANELDVVKARKEAPESQPCYDGGHLPLRLLNASEIREAAMDSDILLVWDAQARSDLAVLRNLAKVEFVDPSYWSGTESHTWGIVADRLRRDTADRSSERYRSLEQQAADFIRSYVFATGPSLEGAMNFEFTDDSLKVVCNSIVRNEKMLEHIDPDVLVFADPVFHFGPSEYADTFREDAVAALRKHDCLGVIPSQHGSLMEGHYPNIEFVSIPAVKLNEPNYPTYEDLRVMATNNVMTLYMLPIASSLTDEVNIIGADGREERESYFWEHNETAQYDDALMKTAVDCHPSFFRDRIYTDYYADHVETLESMIEFGESRGVSYHNLTHSYMPCLAERTVDDPHGHVGECS